MSKIRSFGLEDYLAAFMIIACVAAVLVLVVTAGIRDLRRDKQSMLPFTVLDSRGKVVLRGTVRECEINYIAPGWKHKLYVTRPAATGMLRND